MSRQIAILLTNTDRSDFAARHPDDGEKVAAALRALRPGWRCRVWRAIDHELPPGPHGLDGVVLTGSPASVLDDEDWIARTAAFVRQLHAYRVPTVGLCFGHQLIATALGGQVEQTARWGLGRGQVRLNTRLPWMDPPQDFLNLFAVHQDQVTRLPDGARLLGGSPFCPVGCYVVEDHMLAVQFHPELSRPFMRELLDHFGAEWPADALAQAREDIEQPVDADLFFRWIVNFIEQRAPGA
jgi:GMP synthase-like glutamine amidotransferase